MAVRRLATAGVYDLPPAICWRPARPGPKGCSPSLYWAPQSRCPLGEGVVAYSTDDKVEFAYEAFNIGRDFGPLDIARTVMYCRWVDALCAAHAGCSALVHITSDARAEDRANTVVLCCAYLVLVQGMCATDAFRPFSGEKLTPFLDCRGESAAGSAIADEDEAEFELSVLDILRGLERARDLGWVDYHTFSVEDHSHMLRPEHGDMSWLLPGRALAFASPWSEPQDQDGLPVCTPALLAPYFRRHNLGLVVQCNAPDREEEGERRRLLCYEPRSFEEQGIRHVQLAFEDGGCPSIDILLRFLELVRTCGCGYAVHCRSGLGRTATVIGAYAIQNLGFTARSFIGWARVMRPGTVHGSQQQYLVNLEPYLRPGAARSLEQLDQRERLQLLPRRELRFWALDSGIPAARTRLASEANIIEMILAAHGLRTPVQVVNVQNVAAVHTGPAPSSAQRAPDPAQQARLAAGAALRQQATTAQQPPRVGTSPVPTLIEPRPAAARPVPLGERTPSATSARGPSPSGSYAAPAQEMPAPATVAAATAAAATAAAAASVGAAAAAAAVPTAGGAAPQAQGVTASAADAKANGLNGLNAAIQSLSRGLLSTQSTTATDATLQRTSGSLSSLGSSPPDNSAQRLDEWEEILRYLRLLMAVQAQGAPSWEHVQHFVERLRDRHAGGGADRETAGASEAQALRQLRSERKQALREAEAKEGELSEALQEARCLQRECDQLTFRISLERKARSTERVRMAEHGESLAVELRSTEERLQKTESELEEMQRRMLDHDSLESWQKEKVVSLRQEISAARDTAMQHNIRGKELGARRDAAQEASRRRFREEAAKPSTSVPSSWDDQRRSIERIRDQVHLALQQARMTAVTAP